MKFLGGAVLADVALIGGLLLWFLLPFLMSRNALRRRDI